MRCPHCGGEITNKDISSFLGSKTSEAKKRSSRENGKLGGRPKKEFLDGKRK